jgi:60 kDa SS-A/Ro ribonucleoprotein
MRLQRFLILGSDGGSYYASERTLTRENAQVVLDCLAEDGPRVVSLILEISEGGRAPKQKPLLFALALAMSEGGPKTKDLASFSFNRIVRTGTDLFNFVAEVDTMRGWGRLLRRTIANWYNEKSADEVAFQATKYQQRGGWSHRDLLRLSHPKPPTDSHKHTYNWITQDVIDGKVPDRILGFHILRAVDSVGEVTKVIQDYNMPWETVPSEWLKDTRVWDALLPNLATGAMFRNLARLTSLGMVTRFSDTERIILEKLTDERNFTGTRRLHPLKVLSALNTYRLGHGIRGNLTWEPNGRVLDALDAAFYQSFGAIDPIGQRVMLALDVSGSMCSPDIAGIAGLSPRDASAALALITAATERDYISMAFTAGKGRARTCWSQGVITEFPISPKQRLDDVIEHMNQMPFGGTDCALPMLCALENQIPIDTFIIYTDSETWAGDIHPFQALRDYRNKTGIAAKLVVVLVCWMWLALTSPALTLSQVSQEERCRICV